MNFLKKFTKFSKFFVKSVIFYHFVILTLSVAKGKNPKPTRKVCEFFANHFKIQASRAFNQGKIQG